MNFYNKYILPKLLNYEMNDKNLEKDRTDVAEKASGDVLEIGFGSGLNLPFYKNITKLYALDPSSELFNLAKERISTASFPIEYINASAEKIPLLDNSIDTVVSTWSLCSIPDLASALKEVRRVLKPGGKFLFIEHGLSPKSTIGKFQKILTPISKCYAGGCHLDRKINGLIIESGFEIQSLENAVEKFKPLLYMYKGIATKRI